MQKLTDEELVLFQSLLMRFCAWDMDQHASIKLHEEGELDPVYINIGLEPLGPEEVYTHWKKIDARN